MGRFPHDSARWGGPLKGENMKTMPEEYTPEIGDIITYDNIRSGIRNKCTIGEIVAPGFFKNKPDAPGNHYNLELDLPVRISRPVKGKNKVITVWEPPAQ